MVRLLHGLSTTHTLGVGLTFRHSVAAVADCYLYRIAQAELSLAIPPLVSRRPPPRQLEQQLPTPIVVDLGKAKISIATLRKTTYA